MEGVFVMFFLPSFTLVIFESGAKIPEGKDRTIIGVEQMNALSNSRLIELLLVQALFSTYRASWDETWLLPSVARLVAKTKYAMI